MAPAGEPLGLLVAPLMVAPLLVTSAVIVPEPLSVPPLKISGFPFESASTPGPAVVVPLLCVNFQRSRVPLSACTVPPAFVMIKPKKLVPLQQSFRMGAELTKVRSEEHT